MNFTKLFFYSIIVTLGLTSCSDKFGNGFITKRKYTKGYYFSSNKKKSSSSIASSGAKVLLHRDDVTLETRDKIASFNSEATIVNDSSNVTKDYVFKKVTTTEINQKQNKSLFSSKKSIARDIALAINPERSALIGSRKKNDDWNTTLDAIQFFFMALLFVLFTIIYTVAILSSSPGFPIIFAVALAMVMAIVSIITGIYFY